MKIQILEQDLSKALSIAIRFVNTRTTLPILGNFLLKAEKTTLQIEATNLEMSVSLKIGAKIEEEGVITVPAKIFQEIISNLNQGAITLSVDKEQLKIEGDAFSGFVPCLPANDFPNIPHDIDKKESFEIKAENLSKSLSKVLFSTSLDETRPVLGGVLFIFGEKTLDLVASDGFRLSKKTIILEKKIKGSKLIIPRISIIEILKNISNINSSDYIQFVVLENDNQLLVKIGDIYLTSRLIDGNFPDFEKIIPTSSTTKAILDKSELERAVKLASVFARESANVIKLNVGNDKVLISSESQKGGSQKGSVEAKIEGPTVDISFNYKYIEEFLNIDESNDLEINLTDSISPAVFVDSKDKDFLHLIMPVRIQS